MLTEKHLKKILTATADDIGEVPPPEVPPTVIREAANFSNKLEEHLRSIICTHPLNVGVTVEGLFADGEFEFQCLLSLRGEAALWNGSCDHVFKNSPDVHSFDEFIKEGLKSLVDQYGDGSFDKAVRHAVEQHCLQAAKEEGSYYACLQEDEDSCTLDCGCRLVRDGEAVFLLQCETHELVNDLAKKVAGL
jgi:hypothetical protein